MQRFRRLNPDRNPLRGSAPASPPGGAAHRPRPQVPRLHPVAVAPSRLATGC